MTGSLVEVGAEAPDFTLKNQHGQDVSLSGLRGRNVVVVFYPFAFSGICTGELCEIRDNLAVFNDADAEVLAISCDPMFSLRAWADQDGYEFSMLSDFWPHGEVAKAYGIFQEGPGAAARGTYVIDREGIVRWKVENGLGEARDLAAYREALESLP
ncbi:redoxin domain-containing protein [Aeromicrobium sp. 636]|uniref:peroxiredoxin n=1 Tax=Aeromicrobium TaxID=2040 RepID=UPI0012B5FED2|nr:MULTISPECIES: peroxiredoxin [Aeromicrobium]MCQ3997670.1 redoxin domain-containing protein [Aeromicrobium sp. 636]MTB87597.1 redoxin domain-containing protein [Aeromicrobium senzhongii]